MINVDILNYLPLHIAEIDEFQRISKVYDKYLRLIWQTFDKEELNRFLATMDEDECLRWESLLQIVPSPNDTLEDRVNRIRGYHISDLPYTPNKLDEVLKVICGAGNYTININAEKFLVDCGIKLVSVPMIKVVEDMIRKRVPANMSVNVYALYNRWIRFKELRWADLKDEKWERLYMDKKWQEG